MKKFLLLFIVVAIAAVTYGMWRQGENKTQRQENKAVVERALTKLVEDGVAKHPDVSISEAMQREAKEVTSARLNSESDDKKRRESAASMFFGFYLINVRSRVEYCNQQNVDISAFTNAFATSHTAELAKAQAAFDPPITLDMMYATLEPQLDKMVSQDMSDIANKIGTLTKGACEHMAAHGAALASAMHISKSSPDVFRALNGG